MVQNGPMQKPSMGTTRSPWGPMSCSSASSATNTGGVSCDGPDLQTFPPMVPMVLIAGVPTSFDAVASMGQCRRTMGERAIVAWVTSGPNRSPLVVSNSIRSSPGMPAKAMTCSGVSSRFFIEMTRSVPPATARARSP